eukprot:1511009-Rhodomonas_salina.1
MPYPWPQLIQRFTPGQIELLQTRQLPHLPRKLRKRNAPGQTEVLQACQLTHRVARWPGQWQSGVE